MERPAEAHQQKWRPLACIGGCADRICRLKSEWISRVSRSAATHFFLQHDPCYSWGFATWPMLPGIAKHSSTTQPYSDCCDVTHVAIHVMQHDPCCTHIANVPQLQLTICTWFMLGSGVCNMTNVALALRPLIGRPLTWFVRKTTRVALDCLAIRSMLQNACVSWGIAAHARSKTSRTVTEAVDMHPVINRFSTSVSLKKRLHFFWAQGRNNNFFRSCKGFAYQCELQLEGLHFHLFIPRKCSRKTWSVFI